MEKLNQVLAIEKGTKSRATKAVTGLYHAAQKPQLFTGFVKTFRKTDEAGEDFPPERQKVQMRVDDVLEGVSQHLTELFDVTAARDFANTAARADVVVDDETLITSAPAPYLLFLEKQLTDLLTLVSSLPTLDEAEDWTPDAGASLQKSTPQQVHRTKKVQKAIVLYDATEKHPAQTQLITEDVVIGYWDTVKHSGAITASRKKELLQRVEKLSNAVKFAREQANTEPAPRQTIGAPVFRFLFE